MKTKSAKMLPKTTNEIQNGGVYSQAVRCGKSNCKCARGETHSAFYFFTRRNGKLTKIYVPKSEIETFGEMVERATADRRRNRELVRASADLLSRFRADLLCNDRLIGKLRENQDYE